MVEFIVVYKIKFLLVFIGNEDLIFYEILSIISINFFLGWYWL